SAPVAASRTTTLQDWVDESTPATRVIVAPGSAGAERVLEGQLVEADEVVVALRHGGDVGLLVRRAVGEEVGERLALVERRLGELEDAGRLERLLHLGVGAERLRALL